MNKDIFPPSLLEIPISNSKYYIYTHKPEWCNMDKE